jgi:glucose/arabinose dehydrogenase
LVCIQEEATQMMRAVIVFLAVSLVLASATTVRLIEITRSARGEQATWVFTTSNANYSTDIFTIVKNQVVRRTKDGVTSVVLDAVHANIHGDIVRAAIHPNREQIVVGYRRNSTVEEKVQFVARRHPNNTNSTPVPHFCEIVVFNLTQSSNVSGDASRVNITRFPSFDVTYDFGELRFHNGLLYVGTGNNYPLHPETQIWDFFQQGREDHSLQGKILRIDLDKPLTRFPGESPFTAEGNPFINTTTPSIVWAKGFVWPQNLVWVGETMYATDVMSGAADELNAVVRGEDHGWNVVEGDTCVNPRVNCDKNNKVAPIISIPSGNASVDMYGISGLAHVGRGNFLASWNGTWPQGVIRLLNTTGRTYKDVTVVDYRGVSMQWYYNGVQFVRMHAENDDSPIYVLGQYWGNSSSILFRLEQVDELNGSAHVSVLAALVIALIAALFH